MITILHLIKMPTNKSTVKFLLILSFSCMLFQMGLSQTLSTNNIGDTILSKKLTIGSFCLCQTTVADLRNLDKDLKEIKVEEMDMCNDGFSQDARFVNQKGYYSDKYPGIIFQKDNETDYISKIRLTKEFVGNLPDGTPIDMNHLLAKDVIKLCPRFNTWGSRGCSDYWNLTNDTLSFFVRIDKNKKPQYPIDEAFYLEKPIEGIDLVVSCYGIFTRADHRYKKLFDDPVFFIDSVNVTRIELQKYQPSDIALVTVYKDTNAIKLVGPQGKDGAVYVETKAFARNKYWHLFSERSPEYLNAVPDPQSDSSVAYILNGKVLKENFEGDLSLLDDKSLTEISVIDAEKLKKDFNVLDKRVGVLIKANVAEKHKSKGTTLSN